VTQDQIIDADAARDYALTFCALLADKYEWSAEDAEQVSADIGAAYEEADAADWWGADAGVFWTSLYTRSTGWTVPGAEDASAVFASAAHVNVVDKAEEDDAASLYTQLAGAYDLTVDDVETAATDAASAVKPAVLSWKVWLAAGLGALGLAWWL